MLSAYFTTQIYAFMQIVMSCFSYGGEDTRRLIALVFCVDPKNTHTKTKTPHTPLGGTKRKKRAPTKGTPTHKKNCGSHLLSHTHQDAVPSTPQGLATRFEKETERFPPAITTAKPHNNTFTGITPPRKEWLVASKLYSEHKHTKQI